LPYRYLRGILCVASVADERDGHTWGKPEEVFAALDAGDVLGDLLEGVDGEPVARPFGLGGTDVGAVGVGGSVERGSVGGEFLGEGQGALRHTEEGDL